MSKGKGGGKGKKGNHCEGQAEETAATAAAATTAVAATTAQSRSQHVTVMDSHEYSRFCPHHFFSLSSRPEEPDSPVEVQDWTCTQLAVRAMQHVTQQQCCRILSPGFGKEKPKERARKASTARPKAQVLQKAKQKEQPTRCLPMISWRHRTTSV